MKFIINFHYHENNSEPAKQVYLMDSKGQKLEVTYSDGGLLPNVGDEVVILRQTVVQVDGTSTSGMEPTTGLVEKRTFLFVDSDTVAVNIVIAKSQASIVDFVKSMADSLK
ncbi:hypothetical protein [Hymenobacter negativus]|uniref:Uncharacterized protein n=1 Tax=Hymenobacter negativus TaxID=2795026 RepID=A0ABS0Q356_9BACT|nr:hypothetical protein [Hymenobacter negativus]MBH8556719.1 hypothetical protein [Hymenobacter negativus]